MSQRGETTNTAEVQSVDGAGDEKPVFITKLEENDVLVGRGAPAIANRGNIKFRQLVQSRKKDYMSTSKRVQKDAIARQIVETVQNKRKGRFLRRIGSAEERRQYQVPEGVTAAWILADNNSILEKVKQALRERDSAQPSAEYLPDNSDGLSVSNNDSQDEKEDHEMQGHHHGRENPDINNNNSRSHCPPFMFENTLAAGRGAMGPNLFPPNTQWNGFPMMATAQSAQRQQMLQSMRRQMVSTAFFPRPQDMPRQSFWGNPAGRLELRGGFPTMASMAPNATDIHPESPSRGMFPSSAAVGRNLKRSSVTISSSVKGVPESPSLRSEVPTMYARAKEESRTESPSVQPASRCDSDETSAERALRKAREFFLESGLSPSAKEVDKEEIGKCSENNSKRTREGCLEITLIELLLLTVLISYGLPSSQDGVSADHGNHDGASPVSASARRGGIPKELFTWKDMAAVLQRAAMDYFERQQQVVLGTFENTNDDSAAPAAFLRVEYRAVECATCYANNVPELAAAAVMLLQKVTESAAATATGIKTTSPSRRDEAVSNNESDDDDGLDGSGEDAGKKMSAHAGNSKLLEEAQEEAQWYPGRVLEHYLSELAISVSAYDYEKRRAVARSAVDFVAEHPQHKDDEAMSIAALLSPDCCKVLCAQIFNLSSLRSILLKSKNSGTSFADKLKRILSMGHVRALVWKGRPSWWGAQGDSFHQDLFLIERVLSSGFVGILNETGICLAANYPAPLSLQHLGLTKSAVEDRIMQLSRALQSNEESTHAEELAVRINQCYEILFASDDTSRSRQNGESPSMSANDVSEMCSTQRGMVFERDTTSARCGAVATMPLTTPSQPDPRKRPRFL